MTYPLDTWLLGWLLNPCWSQLAQADFVFVQHPQEPNCSLYCSYVQRDFILDSSEMDRVIVASTTKHSVTMTCDYCSTTIIAVFRTVSFTEFHTRGFCQPVVCFSRASQRYHNLGSSVQDDIIFTYFFIRGKIWKRLRRKRETPKW